MVIIHSREGFSGFRMKAGARRTKPPKTEFNQINQTDDLKTQGWDAK